jgi:hypothetical protein
LEHPGSHSLEEGTQLASTRLKKQAIFSFESVLTLTLDINRSHNSPCASIFDRNHDLGASILEGSQISGVFSDIAHDNSRSQTDGIPTEPLCGWEAGIGRGMGTTPGNHSDFLVIRLIQTNPTIATYLANAFRNAFRFPRASILAPEDIGDLVKYDLIHTHLVLLCVLTEEKKSPDLQKSGDKCNLLL